MFDRAIGRNGTRAIPFQSVGTEKMEYLNTGIRSAWKISSGKVLFICYSSDRSESIWHNGKATPNFTVFVEGIESCLASK